MGFGSKPKVLSSNPSTTKNKKLLFVFDEKWTVHSQKIIL
jgi:hypothetical protein